MARHPAQGEADQARDEGALRPARRARSQERSGAGTYADDEAGACSNTGDGEAVMRLCLAKTACEWMRVGMHPVDAARAAVRMMLMRTGGAGGIILVDRTGRLGFARTTRTMTWAAASDGWGDVLAGG